MKTKTLLLIGAILIAILGALLWWTPSFAPGTNDPIAAVTTFEECQAAGYPIQETYPPRCVTPDGTAFAQDVGNELEHQDMIRIDSPRPNQTVSSPLTIVGEARGGWYFEASFPVRIEDNDGNVLVRSFATAQDEWMTENSVPFLATLTFDPKGATRGTLILENDNPSGLPENARQVRIPVQFSNAASADTLTIQTYFLSDSRNPTQSCDIAFAVNRTIPRSQSTARAALTELLEGPTQAESSAGYQTAIPAGTELNSVVIENGMARADFSSELDSAAGSCRVEAIRTQIEQTLRQFANVQRVEISVEGETEEVLQP